MKRVNLFILILGSALITYLLTACASSADPTTTASRGLITDKREVPRITAEDLKKRLDNGDDVLVIDTRISNQYELRHIPGAIARPSSFEEILRDQEIIAYCA